MTAMTDSQLIDLARTAVHERFRSVEARIVRSTATPLLEGAPVDEDAALVEALAEQLGIRLAPAPAPGSDSADVELPESTELGTRVTVVQIRDGKVSRVIGQG